MKTEPLTGNCGTNYADVPTYLLEETFRGHECHYCLQPDL